MAQVLVTKEAARCCLVAALMLFDDLHTSKRVGHLGRLAELVQLLRAVRDAAPEAAPTEEGG